MVGSADFSGISCTGRFCGVNLFDKPCGYRIECQKITTKAGNSGINRITVGYGVYHDGPDITRMNGPAQIDIRSGVVGMQILERSGT